VTQEEFATRRQVLDRQLEAGIELLRQAHQVQVRALEMVWMTNPAAELTPRIAAGPEVAAQPAPEASPPPGRRTNRGAWALYDDVFDALAKVGPEFERADVCRVLGYEPNRASLQRALKELAGEGMIEQTTPGSGRTPARWVKLPKANAIDDQQP
jgi:hypothetical protein